MSRTCQDTLVLHHHNDRNGVEKSGRPNFTSLVDEPSSAELAKELPAWMCCADLEFLSHVSAAASLEIYESANFPRTVQFDLLMWWKSDESRQPSIASYARKILGIPASSATSERVFSSSNLFFSQLRSNIGDSVACDSIMVHINSKIMDE